MHQLTAQAQSSLFRLKEGNVRFMNNQSINSGQQSTLRRKGLVAGQAPFAIILGCSDSRVPAEFVFDQDLGDLFVIRIAGNVVAASQIGSIEFAIEAFGCPLVIVMGHTHCGAISATVKELQQPVENRSKYLQSIVDRIRPCVDQLLKTDLKNDHLKLEQAAGRANVEASVNQLEHSSSLIETAIQGGALSIIGAEYDLETGHVDFF